MTLEDRRSALVSATVPLLCQYGGMVTTRQIAEAAGVAEGTIFRAFKDKDELVGACVGEVFDPLPALAELDGIDSTATLAERLVAIIGVLQRRLQLVISLSMAMRTGSPPSRSQRHAMKARPVYHRILTRVIELLASDGESFRYPVPVVVRQLWLVTFAGSHPGLTDGRLLSPEQIADLILDGVRRRDEAPGATRDKPRDHPRGRPLESPRGRSLDHPGGGSRDHPH